MVSHLQTLVFLDPAISWQSQIGNSNHQLRKQLEVVGLRSVRAIAFETFCALHIFDSWFTTDKWKYIYVAPIEDYERRGGDTATNVSLPAHSDRG
jgi:hypothetical protein